MPAEHLHAFPHLTTALNGPLQQIETLLLTEQARIKTWLLAEWCKIPAPLYTSVDLRNAGFKLSPVNANLFPAGSQVRIGSLHPELKSSELSTLPSGRQIQDYDACQVILNNDLISGILEQLPDIEQPILPPPGRGWSSRLKFGHFNIVATEFSKLLGIYPWLINPLFRNWYELDFNKREGEDCLVRNVEALLESVQKKYDEYGIDKHTFVVIKADAGTYGMGIISVSSIEEVQRLNRKQRSKIAPMKGGANVSKVILQEGVCTFETWGAQTAAAEPVAHMIDHFVVGGFYREHTGRGIDENLNAPGCISSRWTLSNPATRPIAPANPMRSQIDSMPTACSPAWHCWPPRANWPNTMSRMKPRVPLINLIKRAEQGADGRKKRSLHAVNEYIEPDCNAAAAASVN